MGVLFELLVSLLHQTDNLYVCLYTSLYAIIMPLSFMRRCFGRHLSYFGCRIEFHMQTANFVNLLAGA